MVGAYQPKERPHPEEEEKMSKKVQSCLVAIDGERAYSQDEVWAYYRLPLNSLEFLSYNDREVLAYHINTGLEGLMITPGASVEGIIYVTSSALDVTDWALRWKAQAAKWNPTEGFEDYVTQMQEHMRQQEYLNKEVFVGIMLGKRNGPTAEENPLKSALGLIQSAADRILGNSDTAVSAEELKHWEEKGRDVSRVMCFGPLEAEPATPDEIALMLKRTLYPAMPSPTIDIKELQTWGEGEIALMRESYIEKGHKFLKITQTDDNGDEMVGYRATLCFSRFPETMNFPESAPWMHSASVLGNQFDIYTRFTLVPAEKIRKTMGRKSDYAKDAARNATAAGGEIPLDVQEKYHAYQQIEHQLDRAPEPWVFARHRVVITAATEEELKDNIAKMIAHYAAMQIKLSWPSGDQMALLLESQPADRVRVPSYVRRQSLSVLGGGMPTANASVGDRVANGKGWIGAYIGETTISTRESVHFSPHAVIARNSTPATLITGAPGGGKSFTAFTLTCQLAMQGTWAIYIDPKADALPIANIKGMGKINMLDLRNGNDGILDPFAIGTDVEDSILLALEVVRILLGGSDNALISVLEPVISEVADNPNPSLYKVVELLLDSSDPETRGVGTRLQLMSRLPFARLCFSPQQSTAIKPEDGLTIVTLLGLDLPSAATLSSEYSYQNRLAMSVMFLLTSFTRQLMMSQDSKQPKAVVIDEAWAVTSTASGKKVVNDIARLGRSLNTALILVSQNAADFADEEMSNSVSTILAFRARAPREIAGVLKLLDVEETVEHRRVVSGLNNGECLMKDSDGRISRVQISDWNQEWKWAFDTNPTTRGEEVLV